MQTCHHSQALVHRTHSLHNPGLVISFGLSCCMPLLFFDLLFVCFFFVGFATVFIRGTNIITITKRLFWLLLQPPPLL